MSRREEFVERINTAIEHYYRNGADWESIIMLKKALIPVNNLITIELSERFIKLLFSCNFIREEQCKKMLEDLDGTSANANGFDIFFDGEKKIIAEVKGTVPYGRDCYGAEQKSSIKKDIEYLTVPGAKKRTENIILENYYRFMVLLKSQTGEEDIEAMRNLLKKYKGEIFYSIWDGSDKAKFESDKLNIVFIDLND